MQPLINYHKGYLYTEIRDIGRKTQQCDKSFEKNPFTAFAKSPFTKGSIVHGKDLC